MTKLQEIEAAVCAEFGIDGDTLRMKSNRRVIVEPRQIAMYMALKKTNDKVHYVGVYFGGFHHATVIHAKNAIESLLCVDPKINEIVNRLDLEIDHEQTTKARETIHTVKSIVMKMTRQNMEDGKVRILELLGKL